MSNILFVRISTTFIQDLNSKLQVQFADWLRTIRANRRATFQTQIPPHSHKKSHHLNKPEFVSCSHISLTQFGGNQRLVLDASLKLASELNPQGSLVDVKPHVSIGEDAGGN